MHISRVTRSQTTPQLSDANTPTLTLALTLTSTGATIETEAAEYCFSSEKGPEFYNAIAHVVLAHSGWCENDQRLGSS